MFVDVANGYVYVLIQSHNTKAATYALSVTSYYIEVTVNKDLDDTINLLNRAILTAGDVVYVKNLTDGTTLTLTTHYTIGDDHQSVVLVSEDARDVIEVKYNQYYRVKGKNLSGKKVLASVGAEYREVSISLEPQIGLK
jgi:hypothetical protein